MIMSLLRCGLLKKDAHVEFEGSGLLRYNLHIVKFTLKTIYSSLNFVNFYGSITTTTIKIQNMLSL